MKNHSNIHHSPNIFSAQQISPAAGVGPRNLFDVTIHRTDSSMPAGHSSSPSIERREKSDTQAGQGTNQMTAVVSDAASTEGPGGFRSRVDQQDPLRFSEWPSWIWSRTFCYPLPSTAVIAGNSLNDTFLPSPFPILSFCLIRFMMTAFNSPHLPSFNILSYSLPISFRSDREWCREGSVLDAANCTVRRQFSLRGGYHAI